MANVQKQLYPEMIGEELIEHLSANADRIEEEDIFREYPEDVMNEKKESLVENLTLKHQTEEELAEIRKDLTATIKQAQKRIKELTRQVRAKGEYNSETVYRFTNWENKTVDTYDSYGNFIHSRPMKSADHQLVIKMQDK